MMHEKPKCKEEGCDVVALYDAWCMEHQKHPCVIDRCPNMVEFDDEPWCFTHSPDSGSNVLGYSYKKEQAKKLAEKLDWVEF